MSKMRFTGSVKPFIRMVKPDSRKQGKYFTRA